MAWSRARVTLQRQMWERTDAKCERLTFPTGVVQTESPESGTGGVCWDCGKGGRALLGVVTGLIWGLRDREAPVMTPRPQAYALGRCCGSVM